MPTADPEAVPKRRLVALYVALALVFGAAATTALLLGDDERPAEAIAGGYTVQRGADCFGTNFDLTQSGEFIQLGNPDDTLSGDLRLERRRLHGEVKCVDGRKGELSAVVTGPTDLVGTFQGQPLRAAQGHPPPVAGARPPRAPHSLGGSYRIEPASRCLGRAIELDHDGDTSVVVDGKHRTRGRLSYRDGRLAGRVTCRRGGAATVAGHVRGRELQLTIRPAAPRARKAAPQVPEAVQAEKAAAAKQRTFTHTLTAFLLAIAIVMLAARALGVVAVRLGQPRVMGEIVAGILLGPTLLGALLPGVQTWLFPTDVIPFIGVAANLGLVFYMFLVGLEIDLSRLRGRIAQAAAISNTSVALPLALGMLAAVPLFSLLGATEDFGAFALFMGVAMSITAFPVLARILAERRMLKRPVGAIALACAAIDDVTAWFLVAVATAVATTSSDPEEVLKIVGLALGFLLFMAFVARPLLARVSDAFDKSGGRVPEGWIAVIFAGVLLSAYATERIGIAVIFGAFVMGLVMPRHAELTEDVTHRIQDIVVILLLPLFFAYTGLRTDVGLLDQGELWLITLGLIGIAIFGKFAGAAVAAKLSGFDSKSAAVIGVLMNTRGLTELIVLNIALDQGVISQTLFTMLVIMALVTTFMAGPLLKLLDPRNELGDPEAEPPDHLGAPRLRWWPGRVAHPKRR